ncbi:MAG: hypothetical protein KQ78_02187 [Candidatus Izimaplasma bacterium HR2]|nr:MAG: hypothetical protein KQ78_02187 [Candidatus Izimaplasma bacterium HR2]
MNCNFGNDISEQEIENEYLDEEIIGIDLNYDPKKIIISDDTDTLTASLIGFLRYKGLDVFKSIAPVIKYKGHVVSMRSYKLMSDVSVEDNFEDIYTSLIKDNSKYVFIYIMEQKYNFTQHIDDKYQPVGDPHLHEYRTVRLGVILNKDINEIVYKEI